MKFKMWEAGQNPIVIPNGIPRSSIHDPDPAVVGEIRAAAAADHFCFKIGRFDPDKRWLMAVSAAGYLKRRGRRVRLVIRGGKEPHGGQVLAHAENQELTLVSVNAPREAAGLATILRDNPDADVINLMTFVSDDVLPVIYAASDAVIANSGHEPFGLVGLEVMAAGGLAVTGATGEDYAHAFRNALVMETDDPIELVTELSLLKQRPQLAASMRRRGRVTARQYTWDKVIAELLMRADFAAAQQAVRLPANDPVTTKAAPKTPTQTPKRPARKRPA
jgi:glycosyltransferase involved in cell wall biosynthesis